MPPLDNRIVLITGRRPRHRRRLGPSPRPRAAPGSSRRRRQGGGREARRRAGRCRRARPTSRGPADITQHGRRGVSPLRPARRALQQRRRHPRAAAAGGHRGGVGPGDGGQSQGRLLRAAGGRPADESADADGRVRAARQADPHRVDCRLSRRQPSDDAVLRLQGRRDQPGSLGRAGAGVADRITSNCVCPGAVDTAMSGADRR